MKIEILLIPSDILFSIPLLLFDNENVSKKNPEVLGPNPKSFGI